MKLKGLVVVESSSKGGYQLAFTIPPEGLIDPNGTETDVALDGVMLADLLSPKELICNRPFEVTLGDSITFLGFPYRWVSDNCNDYNNEKGSLSNSNKDQTDDNKLNRSNAGNTMESMVGIQSLFHVSLCFSCEKGKESFSRSFYENVKSEISQKLQTLVTHRFLPRLLDGFQASTIFQAELSNFYHDIKLFLFNNGVISSETGSSWNKLWHQDLKTLLPNYDDDNDDDDKDFPLFPSHLSILFVPHSHHSDSPSDCYSDDVSSLLSPQAKMILSRLKGIPYLLCESLSQSSLPSNLSLPAPLHDCPFSVTVEAVREGERMGVVKLIHPLHPSSIFACQLSLNAPPIDMIINCPILAKLVVCINDGIESEEDYESSQDNNNFLFRKWKSSFSLMAALFGVAETAFAPSMSLSYWPLADCIFNGVDCLWVILKHWGFNSVQDCDKVPDEKDWHKLLTKHEIMVMNLIFQFLLGNGFIKELHQYLHLYAPESLFNVVSTSEKEEMIKDNIESTFSSQQPNTNHDDNTNTNANNNNDDGGGGADELENLEYQMILLSSGSLLPTTDCDFIPCIHSLLSTEEANNTTSNDPSDNLNQNDNEKSFFDSYNSSDPASIYYDRIIDRMIGSITLSDAITNLATNNETSSITITPSKFEYLQLLFRYMAPRYFDGNHRVNDILIYLEQALPFLLDSWEYDERMIQNYNSIKTDFKLVIQIYKVYLRSSFAF